MKGGTDKKHKEYEEACSTSEVGTAYRKERSVILRLESTGWRRVTNGNVDDRVDREGWTVMTWRRNWKSLYSTWSR